MGSAIIVNISLDSRRRPAGSRGEELYFKQLDRQRKARPGPESERKTAERIEALNRAIFLIKDRWSEIGAGGGRWLRGRGRGGGRRGYINVNKTAIKEAIG